MARSLSRVFGQASNMVFLALCLLAVVSNSRGFVKNHHRNLLNAVTAESVHIETMEPIITQPQPSIASPTLQPLGSPAPTAGSPSPIDLTPESAPIAAPIAVPTPVIAPVLQPQTIPLPPYLQIPAASNTCIGNSPGPMFTCDQGIWVTTSSLTVGVGGDMLSLIMAGPTYIGGNLTILANGNWTMIPPLESEQWNPQSTKAMLTVKKCVFSIASPRLVLTAKTTQIMFKGKSSGVVFTKTVGGIDSACDMDRTAKSWNLNHDDAQHVYASGARKCEITVAQYREFPSETDPARFMMRLRLQWKNNGNCSNTVVIVLSVVGGLVAVFGVIGCVFCGGGSGGDGSSSTNSDYGSTSNFDSGGGGGGGGGFASSSAGSWD